MARRKQTKAKEKSLQSILEAAFLEVSMKSKSICLQLKQMVSDNPKMNGVNAQCVLQQMWQTHTAVIVILSVLMVVAMTVIYTTTPIAPIAPHTNGDNLKTFDVYRSFDGADPEITITLETRQRAEQAVAAAALNPNHALNVNQPLCRMQPSPAPIFDQQLETGNEDPSHVELPGCHDLSSAGKMSDAERDITAIMSQLQQNAKDFSPNRNSADPQMNAPPGLNDVLEEESETLSKKKAKKKRRRQKKPKFTITVTEHTRDGGGERGGGSVDATGTDELPTPISEADDEDDAFGIDDVMMGIHGSHRDDADTDEEEEEEEDQEAQEPEEEEVEDAQSESSTWQPRRSMSAESDERVDDPIVSDEDGDGDASDDAYTMHKREHEDLPSVSFAHHQHHHIHLRERPPQMEDQKKMSDGNDTDIDVNLMAMYQRGLAQQLNKMHYASDKAYEQLVEDISVHGLSQHEIFHKYRINFIPDEATFTLIPPPTVMDVRNYYGKHKHYVHSTKVAAASANVRMMRDYDKINQNRHKSENVNVDAMKRKMRAGAQSKSAFKSFYALTRMQQKYLTPLGELKADDDVDDDDDDSEEDYEDGDDELVFAAQSQPPDTHADGNRTSTTAATERLTAHQRKDMNVLRAIHKTAPVGILHSMLNDEKLPQWLYEGDTILDLNCGVGDALIYLLHNFTTIRGICVVGTSRLKAKYAALNVALHGLSDRIEIVARDLYDPYVTSRFNESDIIYVDWYNVDDEYFYNYFTARIMNDHDMRAAKPGRVILSYNRPMFDAYAFQASYTLHFSSGWHLAEVQPMPLPHDVKVYLYSIPFYLSKLSNMYVQNYQVFYGYRTVWTRVDGDQSAADNGTHSLDQPITMDATRSKQNILRIMHRNGENKQHKVQIETAMHHTFEAYQGLGHEDTDNAKKPTATVERGNEHDGDFTIDDDDDDDDDDDLIDDDFELSYDKANYQHLKARDEALSAESEEYEALFELNQLIAGELNTDDFANMDEVSDVLSTLYSQLLYQSFINAIQSVLNRDAEHEYSQILLKILNTISARHAHQAASATADEVDGPSDGDDKWQYLQHHIFTAHKVDSCQLYGYIEDEWRLELNNLLQKFASLFLYDPVKDAANSKLQSLFDLCP